VLFDSPVYFAFLVAVVVAYWSMNWRSQNIFLLAASYFFYGWWDWRFLGLIFLSTTGDFIIAQWLDRSDNERHRRCALVISLILNLSFLGFFKYFNFFTDSLVSLLTALGLPHSPTAVLRVILPPGISFYTFQEIAYIVDVYQRKQRPAKSFIDYGLFVSLFPHLIAGPIQRPSHLLTQVQAPRTFSPGQACDGFMLILMGLFRKCVFADNFAALANAAFASALGHNAFATLVGAVAFGFQIYGDFCGYSDIARGSAKLLGFEFAVNFRRPYLAQSLQDFWHRWHISLSTWLRDYLYIPLGGSRAGTIRTYANLIITMVLGGLWHGANWTFVVWGGLHGFALAAERWLRGLVGVWGNLPTGLARLVPVLARTGTLAVVLLAWLFFRAPNVSTAMSMLRDLRIVQWRPDYQPALLCLLCLGAAVVAMDLVLEQADDEYLFQSRPRLQLATATATASALILFVCIFGAAESSAFIYFQF
jgi:D-alanyl-lipoteichoic acid acyltransferase DltB (MBOAT superfamily)